MTRRKPDSQVRPIRGDVADEDAPLLPMPPQVSAFTLAPRAQHATCTQESETHRITFGYLGGVNVSPGWEVRLPETSTHVDSY